MSIEINKMRLMICDEFGLRSNTYV